MASDIKTKLAKAATLYETACSVAEIEKQNLILASEKSDNALEARLIIQQLSTTVQQNVHSRIAAIVSRCLETVFDEPYSFLIKFENKRGRTEAILTFVRGDLEADPMESCGGGVVDVAAFALRLACLCLSKPRLRKLLVLDEPMRFLSKHHQPSIAKLLLSLAEELKVQIIMVTHNPVLQVGTVIEIGD